MSAVTQPELGFEELRPPLGPAEAVVEADRCLECGGPHAPAPCAVACPAGVDVARFIAQIADGEPGAAAETIFEQNILGATCARVCPVEVLCEGACVLEHEGRPAIAIGALQRYATDWHFERGLPLRTRARATGRRVVVIGAGPSGLACAGELAARGISVTVFDEREELGGLVRYAIAPYRQVCHPLPDEGHALEELGVELRLGTRIDSREELEAATEDADAVFFGVGLGADTKVSYPGDELRGVWESLPFIEAIKTGQPPKVGSHVVVIGGGNTAIDVAREALRLGADDVTVLYRRTEAEMPAYDHEIEEARDEGIRFRLLAAPVAFLGTWDDLEQVECIEMTLGEPDESGRRRPMPLQGSTFTLQAYTAVKAIGQQPRDELAEWVEGLELDRGKVVVDGSGRTGNRKFFAGGDAINGGASVVEAVRDGRRAADAIEKELRCRS